MCESIAHTKDITAEPSTQRKWLSAVSLGYPQLQHLSGAVELTFPLSKPSQGKEDRSSACSSLKVLDPCDSPPSTHPSHTVNTGTNCYYSYIITSEKEVIMYHKLHHAGSRLEYRVIIPKVLLPTLL